MLFGMVAQNQCPGPVRTVQLGEVDSGYEEGWTVIRDDGHVKKNHPKTS